MAGVAECSSKLPSQAGKKQKQNLSKSYIKHLLRLHQLFGQASFSYAEQLCQLDPFEIANRLNDVAKTCDLAPFLRNLKEGQRLHSWEGMDGFFPQGQWAIRRPYSKLYKSAGNLRMRKMPGEIVFAVCWAYFLTHGKVINKRVFEGMMGNLDTDVQFEEEARVRGPDAYQRHLLTPTRTHINTLDNELITRCVEAKLIDSLDAAIMRVAADVALLPTEGDNTQFIYHEPRRLLDVRMESVHVLHPDAELSKAGETAFGFVSKRTTARLAEEERVEEARQEELRRWKAEQEEKKAKEQAIEKKARAWQARKDDKVGAQAEKIIGDNERWADLDEMAALHKKEDTASMTRSGMHAPGWSIRTWPPAAMVIHTHTRRHTYNSTQNHTTPHTLTHEPQP